MTNQVFLGFCKFAGQENFASTLALKYNRAVQNIGQKYNIYPKSMTGGTNMQSPTTNGMPKGMSNFNIGGQQHRLQNDLGQRLIRANAEYFKNTGQNIKITSGYRSPQEQQNIINRMGGRPIPGKVAPVGMSLHQYGGAIDISNWQQAAPYLQRQGLINPISSDKVHFRSVIRKTEGELRRLYGGS